MGIDRESAVRKAEDLVREGKIDLAIEEYLRLVEDQPGDVGAANALGDLYAKVGNRAAAVAQFAQIGDNHRESGFIPKAVAFYKKALKVDPASDHALSQLAAIAVEQELYADATLYLNRLLQRRREQHNEAGVTDCLVRLGGFPTATADAKLAAARASASQLSADQTARLWVDAADALERAGRGREAVDVLMQAATLQPEDPVLRRRVALACATTGQIDRARAFLSFETAADQPDLLLALAEQSLAEGRDVDARRALERVIEVAPDRRVEAEAMLAPLATDAAATPGEPPDVAAAFGAGQEEAPAVEHLDVVEQTAPAAETEPADLEWSSLFGEATSEPEAEAPNQRPVEPEPEPDFHLQFESEVVADDAVYVVPDNEAPEPQAETVEPGIVEPEIVEPEVVEPEVVEPELVTPVIAEAPSAPAPEPAPEPQPAASQADLDSIAALTAAAANPALQFQASAQLGRLLLRLGRTREGIEWLDKATQATTVVREQRLDVMYELADALERAGERGHALDVFADLDFDAASYRDVPERMAALRRGLGEGHAT